MRAPNAENPRRLALVVRLANSEQSKQTLDYNPGAISKQRDDGSALSRPTIITGECDHVRSFRGQ